MGEMVVNARVSVGDDDEPVIYEVGGEVVVQVLPEVSLQFSSRGRARKWFGRGTTRLGA